MRMIILISSFLVLISCIVMAIVQIKEKKFKSPFMLLIVFTFFIAFLIQVQSDNGRLYKRHHECQKERYSFLP